MHAPNGLDRRRFGAALAAFALVGCSSPTGSPMASSTSGPSPSPVASPSPSPAPSFEPLEGVGLEPIVSGLVNPIGITNAGDGSARLFVNERGGRIRVVNADGTLAAADFVDLSDRLQEGGEQGLLGVAFHPDFAANGRVFVHYSRPGDGATVISELTASADRGTADPASERVIFTLHQPFANHNGGQIAFGPDGYLYIGLGDGGSGGDPEGNGQNRQVLLGKILRIDVDGPPAADREYAIPDSNPYAAGGVAPGDGLPEIWAYGLRNPWRFAFDRATGDLFIADVGQGEWEEIDVGLASRGGGENYGWNITEGNHCFQPAVGCPMAGMTLPVLEYNHDEGCSVTGGVVYRGCRLPGYAGTYFYADYCTHFVRSFRLEGGRAVDPRDWTAVLGRGLDRPTSFGVDADGEVHIVDQDGEVYRVVPAS